MGTSAYAVNHGDNLTCGVINEGAGTVLTITDTCYAPGGIIGIVRRKLRTTHHTDNTAGTVVRHAFYSSIRKFTCYRARIGIILQLGGIPVSIGHRRKPPRSIVGVGFDSPCGRYFTHKLMRAVIFVPRQAAFGIKNFNRVTHDIIDNALFTRCRTLLNGFRG